MIDYAYLTTLSSLARVRKNARQWDFFCWLLSQADEDGYAEVSVREYAAMKGLPRTTVKDWLFSSTFRPLLEATKLGGRTLVFFCDYASYVNSEKKSSSISRPNFVHFSSTSAKVDEKTEEKFPPAPL